MDSVDRNWSWVVLFGAFLANLLAGGIVFSFGILYTDFLDRLQTGALETAFIGAIAFACFCFGAPFSRTMTSYLGYRFVTVTGSVIGFLGLLLGCFAPSIHYYYVFFGLLVGSGFSMISVATFLAVKDYFMSNMTIAVTLASCGFPAGVFLLPLITQALFETYSFFGTFMILSALMLNGVVCGLLFKPLVKNVMIDRDKQTYKQMVNPIEDAEKPDEATTYNEESVTDDENRPDEEGMKLQTNKHPRYKAIERREETIVIPITEPIRFESVTIDEELEEDESDGDEDTPREEVKVVEHIDKEPKEEAPSEIKNMAEPDGAVKEAKENTKTLLNVIIGVNDGKMLCDFGIILYLLASVLFSFGLGIPISLFPDVAREYGYSNSKAEWTLSLLGLGACFGIVISGFVRRLLSDRLESGCTLLVCITLVLSGLSIGFIHYLTNYGVLLLSAFLFGTFSVVFHFLRSNVVCELVTEEYFTPAYYLSIWICGVGYIIGIPVSAWLKDHYGTYAWAYVMAALGFGASALFMFPLIFLRRRHSTR